MKTIELRYFFYLLLLFATWLLPASCSSEDEAATEFAVLHLGVTSDRSSSLTTYGIPGTSDENTVERMRILIFNSQTLVLEENEYYDPAPGLPTNLSFPLRMGSKRILVLGNEPTALSQDLSDLTSFSKLQELIMSDASTISATSSRLPFCTTKEVNLSLSAPSEQAKIVLERSVGKIQLHIAKDATNSKTVELKSIQLTNVPAESSLIDGYHLPSPAFTDLSPQTSGLITDMGTTPTTLNITNPYIYENFALTSDLQTHIQVIISQNGSLMTTDIPLVCGTNALGKYEYGVRRNTISNMTLTVFEEHIKLEYTVLPWSKEGSWNEELGEKPTTDE